MHIGLKNNVKYVNNFLDERGLYINISFIEFGLPFLISTLFTMITKHRVLKKMTLSVHISLKNNVKYVNNLLDDRGLCTQHFLHWIWSSISHFSIVHYDYQASCPQKDDFISAGPRSIFIVSIWLASVWNPAWKRAVWLLAGFDAWLSRYEFHVALFRPTPLINQACK
jgi:hypothetical protein